MPPGAAEVGSAYNQADDTNDSSIVTGIHKPSPETYTLILALNILNGKDHDGKTPMDYDYTTKAMALQRVFIHVRTLGIMPVYETLNLMQLKGMFDNMGNLHYGIFSDIALESIIYEWSSKWLPKINELEKKLDDPVVLHDLIGSFRNENILSLKDIYPKKIRGKVFVVRVDFNDIHYNPEDSMIDDIRLNAAFETLVYIIRNKGKVVLVTHYGRPSGVGVEEEFSVEHIAAAVEKLLKIPVKLLRGKEIAPNKYSIVTNEIADEVQRMQEGEAVLLENARFDWREKSSILADREGLVYDLSRLGDIYVLDGFPISHRGDSTVIEAKKVLPSIAGFWMKSELEAHNEFLKLIKSTERGPMAVLFGGKKKDKIPLIIKFTEQLKTGDIVMFGNVLSEFIINEHNKFIKRLQAKGIRVMLSEDTIEGKDIGGKTLQSFIGALDKVWYVYWNGPMGEFEVSPYEKNSYCIARAIKAQIDAGKILKAFVSGGETAFLVKSALSLTEQTRQKIPNLYISTGGGTSTDFFAYERNIGMENLWGISSWYGHFIPAAAADMLQNYISANEAATSQ
ncbi:MAG: phosphoglycerate kinase [bacterium]